MFAAFSLLLPKISEVKIMLTVQRDTDGKPVLFALWLNTRVDTLRAKMGADSLLLVETLNKINEELGSNTDASSASVKYIISSNQRG
jgi:hypothetical protein